MMDGCSHIKRNVKELDGSDPSWEAVSCSAVHFHAVRAVCGCPLAVLLPPTRCNSTLERLTGESRHSLHDQPTSFLTRSLCLCTHACTNTAQFSNFPSDH